MDGRASGEKARVRIRAFLNEPPVGGATSLLEKGCLRKARVRMLGGGEGGLSNWIGHVQHSPLNVVQIFKIWIILDIGHLLFESIGKNNGKKNISTTKLKIVIGRKIRKQGPSPSTLMRKKYSVFFVIN